MLEGKTTVSLILTTDAFHELERFPQETPEQPHPNTPFFLPGGPGNLFKLTIHWIFIYTKWKRATKVPVQQSQILLFHRICLEMQVLMLSANKDLPYPGNELPSKKGTLSYAFPPEFGFNLVLQNLFPCQVKEEMQCEFSSIHRMATDIEEGRDISLKLISIHLQE